MSEGKRVSFQYDIDFDRIVEYKSMEAVGLEVDLLVRPYDREGNEILMHGDDDVDRLEAVTDCFVVYVDPDTRDIIAFVNTDTSLRDTRVGGNRVLRADAAIVGLNLLVVDHSEGSEERSRKLVACFRANSIDMSKCLNQEYPIYCSARGRVSSREAYAVYDRSRDAIRDVAVAAECSTYRLHNAGGYEGVPHISTNSKDNKEFLILTSNGAKLARA